MTCGAPDCDRPSRTAQLCWAHYKRRLRTGSFGSGAVGVKRAKGEGGLRNGYVVHTVNGESIYEHRQVAEQSLGRPLTPFENVHHKNGVRTDNRPENLEVWTTYQPSGQRVSDLVAFVAKHYAIEVLDEINRSQR